MTDYKLVPVELIEHICHARRELTRKETAPLYVRQRLAQRITDLLAAVAPAVQGGPVPSWKHEALIAHSKQQDRIIAEMRDRLHTVSLYEQREVWFWQGDGEDYPESLSCPVVIKADDLRKILKAAPQPAEQHPDDAAVDAFAAAMKAKLAKKRGEGRHGWQSMSAAELGALLYQHIYKADPLDVGNIAMMIHQNDQAIELPLYAQGSGEQPDVAQLVEALELIEKGEGEWGAFRWKDCHNIAVEALAAYRSRGEV